MSDSHLVELRIIGAGLEPGLVRSREIGELLEALEDSVASVVAQLNVGITKEAVIVGITSIASGSISLQFDSPQRNAVFDGFLRVSEAVATSRFKSLPNSSRRSLAKVSAFARRHDCRAEFRVAKEREPLAIIDPSTQVAEPELVFGETTLYGKVIRVGGRTPRVMIETSDGASVYCDSSPTVAKELAPKLYERVRLIGRAGWDPDDWSLVEFRIHDAEPGPDLDPASVLEQLSVAIGGYFAEVGDPETFVRRLRQGEGF